MAKDSAGRKYNRIEAYDRKVDGKTIHVREHVRSNMKTCTGQKKSQAKKVEWHLFGYKLGARPIALLSNKVSF